MEDVLTREQLLEQRTRRESLLHKLQDEGAPPEAIRQAEKRLKLTERRLERMEKINAECEYSVSVPVC